MRKSIDYHKSISHHEVAARLHVPVCRRRMQWLSTQMVTQSKLLESNTWRVEKIQSQSSQQSANLPGQLWTCVSTPLLVCHMSWILIELPVYALTLMIHGLAAKTHQNASKFILYQQKIMSRQTYIHFFIRYHMCVDTGWVNQNKLFCQILHFYSLATTCSISKIYIIVAHAWMQS